MKSVPLAVVLGLLLGPLGLLYVGMAHAAAALAAGAALALASGGRLALMVPFSLACGVWGAIAASRQGPRRPAAPLAYRPTLAARAPVTVELPLLGSGSDSGKFCFQCGAYLTVSARACNRCGASAEAA